MGTLFSLSKSATSTALDTSEIALLLFGILLTIGLIGEYAKSERWKRYVRTFEMFVIIGVAGELLADGGIFLFSSHLQTIADQEIGELTKEAGDAKDSAKGAAVDAANAGASAKQAIADSSMALAQAKDALTNTEKAARSLGKAEKEANDAQAASFSALALAKGAREEADSFKKDIASAMTLAAEAESHLRDALKQAEDATAELNRLKTHRSLTGVTALVSTLGSFKGTEFGFMGVFADQESANLAEQISDALQSSGWTPTNAPNTGRGSGPFIRIKNFPASVQPSISTGVNVDVEIEEAVEDINKLPVPQKPKQVQAVIALKSALALSISPAQPDLATTNFGTAPANPKIKPRVLITVGKKP
jgi:hypothetical protein